MQNNGCCIYVKIKAKTSITNLKKKMFSRKGQSFCKILFNKSYNLIFLKRRIKNANRNYYFY